MIPKLCAFIFGALFTLVASVVGILLWPVEPKPAIIILPVRHYNVVFSDGEKISLEGDFIRSNGLCIEIWLRGRLDTVICRPALATEAIEPIPVKPSAPDKRADIRR